MNLEITLRRIAEGDQQSLQYTNPDELQQMIKNVVSDFASRGQIKQLNTLVGSLFNGQLIPEYVYEMALVGAIHGKQENLAEWILNTQRISARLGYGVYNHTSNHIRGIIVNRIPPAVVVHIKRQNGQIVQDCDIYIGRACNMGGWRLPQSKWHNPFSVKKIGNLDEVIRMYEEYVRQQTSLMNQLGELIGKRLGCWCKPKACHGDVLVKLLAEELVRGRF